MKKLITLELIQKEKDEEKNREENPLVKQIPISNYYIDLHPLIL